MLPSNTDGTGRQISLNIRAYWIHDVHDMLTSTATACYKLLTKMPRAWYIDSLPGDQRLEHRLEGREDVPIQQLASLGVLYWKVCRVERL